MDQLEKAWKERRQYFLDRLDKDILKGRVDYDIINLLKLINSINFFYTLSSCSGRIQFLEGPSFSNRKNLKSLAKFHQPITKDDLVNIIDNFQSENLWASVQPPIFHIASNNLENAYKLLKIARGIGFKHSGILAINKDRYVVELNSSIRIDFPIKIKGYYLIDLNNIDFLVEMLNNYLNRAKELLKKLEKEILKLKNSLT